MNKPKKYQAEPYYDLLEVLDYVEQTVPRAKRKIWHELCNRGYINNNTITNIYFEGLIDEDMPEEVLEGINYMFKEFSDIKNDEVDFRIYW